MAEEIRIFRNDSAALSFLVLDADTEDNLDLSPYEIIFSTENYEKTSVSKPLEVKKDHNSEGKQIILVYLTTIENNPVQEMLHYDLKIYELANPTIIITGSSGDLKFITE